MCGRVNVSDHLGVQALLHGLGLPIYLNDFKPRYNIAPGADLHSIFYQDSDLQWTSMQWGIVPHWAKNNADKKNIRPLINARSETVWEKSSFRKLIKSQRAVIPINGFYEWHRAKTQKTAYYFTRKDETAIALAAIYQISSDGIMQCCLLTTPANQAMSHIHHRMPVILEHGTINEWLCNNDMQHLNQLMLPTNNEVIRSLKVSSYVNNAAHDGPQCIEEHSINTQ